MDEIPDDIKEYELAFLARSEAEVKNGLEFIRRSGAEIFFEGPVERITLAYAVKHEPSAHFGYLHLRISPASASSLAQSIRTNNLFLRFLMITPPFLRAKPRPSLRPRTREMAVPLPQGERASSASLQLSNEALEKKIEEILRE